MRLECTHNSAAAHVASAALELWTVLAAFTAAATPLQPGSTRASVWFEFQLRGCVTSSACIRKLRLHLSLLERGRASFGVSARGAARAEPVAPFAVFSLLARGAGDALRAKLLLPAVGSQALQDLLLQVGVENHAATATAAGKASSNGGAASAATPRGSDHHTVRRSSRSTLEPVKEDTAGEDAAAGDGQGAGVDDALDDEPETPQELLDDVLDALRVSGMSAGQVDDLLATVAAIMHLNMAEFRGTPGKQGCTCVPMAAAHPVCARACVCVCVCVLTHVRVRCVHCLCVRCAQGGRVQ